MIEIQRYEFYTSLNIFCDTEMRENDKGDWVKYEDHLKIVEELQQQIEILHSRIIELEEKLRWISVSERLPEIKKDGQNHQGYDIIKYPKVLVISGLSIQKIQSAEYIGSNAFMCICGCGNEIERVIKWRETPELEVPEL